MEWERIVVAIMEMNLIALIFTIPLVLAAGAADPGKHRISLAGIIMYNFPAFQMRQICARAAPASAILTR